MDEREDMILSDDGICLCVFLCMYTLLSVCVCVYVWKDMCLYMIYLKTSNGNT